MTVSTRTILTNILLVSLAFSSLARAQKVSDRQPTDRVLHAANFDDGKHEGWTNYGADVVVGPINGIPALQTQGDSQVFWGDASDQTKRCQDVSIEGDVTVERNDASSGFIVRATRQTNGSDCSGYYACIRKLGAGYVIVQLFRLPEFALLALIVVVKERARGAGDLRAAVTIGLEAVFADQRADPRRLQLDRIERIGARQLDVEFGSGIAVEQRHRTLRGRVPVAVGLPAETANPPQFALHRFDDLGLRRSGTQ